MEEEKKYTVYIHRNKLNNKCYVGITCRVPEVRWGKDGHNYLEKKNGKYRQEKFARAILKYDWDNFEHIIWGEGFTHDKACEIECLLIKFWDTVRNGYNISAGGEGSTGVTRSEESRKKISNALKGKMAGEKNPNYGKQMSEEQKQKLSIAKKGLIHTDEEKRKISESLKRTFSDPDFVPYDRNGVKNPRARKVAQYTKDGELIKVWDYMKQACDELGICKSCIIACCRHKRRTAGGYRWEYVD